MSLYYTIRRDGMYDTWDGDTGFYMGTSPTGPTPTNTYQPFDWANYQAPPSFYVCAPGTSLFGYSGEPFPPERTVSGQQVTFRWCIPNTTTPIIPDPGGGAPSGGWTTGKWRMIDWAISIIRVSGGATVAAASGVGAAGAVPTSGNSGTSTVVMAGLPEGTHYALIVCHAYNAVSGQNSGNYSGSGRTANFTIAAPPVVIPPPPTPPPFFASMGQIAR